MPFSNCGRNIQHITRPGQVPTTALIKLKLNQNSNSNSNILQIPSLVLDPDLLNFVVCLFLHALFCKILSSCCSDVSSFFFYFPRINKMFDNIIQLFTGIYDVVYLSDSITNVTQCLYIVCVCAERKQSEYSEQNYYKILSQYQIVTNILVASVEYYDLILCCCRGA